MSTFKQPLHPEPERGDAEDRFVHGALIACFALPPALALIVGDYSATDLAIACPLLVASALAWRLRRRR